MRSTSPSPNQSLSPQNFDDKQLARNQNYAIARKNNLSISYFPANGLELLSMDSNETRIVSMCKCLDEMLCGGISARAITELCGASSAGKSQLCMQLCVCAQIPSWLGGVRGKVIFVDTEGTFSPARVIQMAAATQKHLRESWPPDKSEQISAEFSIGAILENIVYFRCAEQSQLVGLVERLFDFVALHPQVRLVIIDSIAYHFRYDSENFVERSKTLQCLARNLLRLATCHRLAVVLSNQMTTKLNCNGRGKSELVPALGESWAHVSSVRVLLEKLPPSSSSSSSWGVTSEDAQPHSDPHQLGGANWKNTIRIAKLIKHPSESERSALYQITGGGIRDVI